jgi:putative ABC transport system substrate-binding protein
MRRREVVAGVVALIARPDAAPAQQLVQRVGVLFPAGDTPGSQDLVQALRKLGYLEGRNISYDIRAADGEPERLPLLARQIIAGKPDVIVSATSAAARALTDATREIPIVLAIISDPVALGVTQSIARPTGNVTGFTTGHDTVAAKRLELLHEMVPTARKVALLWVLANSQHQLLVDLIRQAALPLHVELLSFAVTHAEDIPPALAKAVELGAAALLVAADPLTVRNRRIIIDECLLLDLPAMHGYSFEVRDGALMSYGGDAGENYAHTAAYVDRLLKGARIAELPFQEPTQIRLAINLRTARSMRLTVPPTLLARADEVIE